jgi:hypothetical protein
MAAARSALDKRTKWHFLVDDGETWTWEKAPPSGGVEHSTEVFLTLDQCARDAAKYGYGAWTKDERRRVERRYDALLVVE